MAPHLRNGETTDSLADLVRLVASPESPGPIAAEEEDLVAILVQVHPPQPRAIQERRSSRQSGRRSTRKGSSKPRRPSSEEVPEPAPASMPAQAARDAEGLPSVLVLRGCRACPELNGTYYSTDAFAEYLEHDVPTFHKKTAPQVYCYFWYEPDNDASNGWTMSREVEDDDATLGFCPGMSRVPPSTGWKFARASDGKPVDDPGGFFPLEENLANAQSTLDQ